MALSLRWRSRWSCRSLRLSSLMRRNSNAHIYDEFEALTDRVNDMGEAHARAQERLERGLRGDIAESARVSRMESQSGFTQFHQTLATQLASTSSVQNAQFDALAQQLAQQSQQAREDQGNALKRFADSMSLHLVADVGGERAAARRGACDARSASEGHRGQQRDEARRDAPHRRRKAARNARTAARRVVQARVGPAGASASRARRNADARGRRRRSEEGADQRQDARHLGRSAARSAAGAVAYAGSVREERRDDAEEQRARRVRDQASGPARCARRAGRRRDARVAAYRRQVSARGLRAPDRRAGTRGRGRESKTRRARSKAACARKRSRSRKSTSRRRTPRTSRCFFCRPKDSTRKCCAAPA